MKATAMVVVALPGGLVVWRGRDWPLISTNHIDCDYHDITAPPNGKRQGDSGSSFLGLAYRTSFLLLGLCIFTQLLAAFGRYDS
jgi:hypothetical protein